TREATGLLAWAIDSIGDNFAVHGFASDGRHDVQYYRFKDFEQPYDDDAKSRMAAMKGNLSTRMGAALRHAGWHLTQQNAQKRLVLLITDGEPADIDERDPQYLRHDTKKAVEDLAMQGVYTYCLTLDPNADRYVARIFGENNFSIVDHVERLPERLPNVFAALTG
ncbi:MAG: nitric oxide reductase activation protein NorD, partial [Gammaproteobacteria bacterium]|nr:nitric oxide reductase activation protein NorD [Gammaproteobacteria bacterium]